MDVGIEIGHSWGQTFGFKFDYENNVLIGPKGESVPDLVKQDNNTDLSIESDEDENLLYDEEEEEEEFSFL